MRTHPLVSIAFAVAFVSLWQAAHAAEHARLDVPFVPTPEPVVEAMLKAAEVDSDDVVYDLGSGDGRIVIMAAERFGARGVGIDLNPERVREARENAKAAGVEDRVEFVQGDLFDFDFSEATALTLYLLPSVNLKLRPKILEELAPGTPVVSHAFDMGEWEPDETVEVERRNIFVWYVPAEVAGIWRWRGDNDEQYRLVLEQEFQRISGYTEVDGEQIAIAEPRLRGNRLSFTFEHPEEGLQRVETQLDGDRLVGGMTPAGENVAAERVEWVAELETASDMARGDVRSPAD